MYRESETRRSSVASAVFAVAMIALMSYLTFAALQGEHGLFRLFRIEAQEKQLRAELDRLREARATVANKTRRLSVEHLDLELLDEQARRVLSLGRADELILR